MAQFNDNILQKLKLLPTNPGCYLMKNKDGQVIYVGKAINLKNRVRSYFKANHTGKTAALVENITDFDTVIVDSEADALILESNLIKEYHPHYNILLRDDKHYPYLCLTLNEKYPRLLVVRRAKNDGNRYFGPYVSAGAMRHARQLIQDIFPLRTCSGRSWRAGQRACLNAHIGRCLAPCEQRISAADYSLIVNQVQQFLEGKTKDLLKQTEQKMLQAAQELNFEEAARLRDALNALQNMQVKQQLDKSAEGGNHDIIALANEGDQAVVQVFFVRGGKVCGREHFFLKDGLDDQQNSERKAIILRRFLQEYYGNSEFMPRQIYARPLPENNQLLMEIFAQKSGHKVEITEAKRGDKLRLLNLVEQNAILTLNQFMSSKDKREEKAAKALDSLRIALNLPAAPTRMECYDISHIQGSYMVGSMVVFINGLPAPKHYRRFKIKTLDQSNDFAALQEVLSRRWQRGLTERAEGKKPLDFGNWPNLLIIDGGKGQLSSVCSSLAAISNDLPPIISLAKREEEIFLPNISESLILDKANPALQLLQAIRDEAHRFAITYHRSLRGKGQVKSLLDDAPGIGAKRKKALLKAFGNLENIKKADLEELIAAPGMTKSAAQALYDFLHQQP